MSIKDWYSNSEGSGWDAPGVDGFDDDRPDRSVDSWLDRAAPVGGAALPGDGDGSVAALGDSVAPMASSGQPVVSPGRPGGRAAGGNQRAPRRPARPRSSRDVAKGKHKQNDAARRLAHMPPPRWRDIVWAVHDELARDPRRSAEALHEVLVMRGGSFAKLRLVDVEEAMATPAPRTQGRPKLPAEPRPPLTNRANWAAPVPREPVNSQRFNFIGLPMDASAVERRNARGRTGSAGSAKSSGVRGLALVGVCSSCSGPIQETGACRCSR
ncbi:hypothetical protein AB0M20_04215 [Actinoplanes sp. NPDC051633]|uniref:hypothetical protein n=1 Tax=Actinoplanes sp. NPDC051633 TaxID=3155670 RepID=UPI003416F3F3